MNLTAPHINYHVVCRRKLWLFANGITMEHTSDTVYDGKLLHEASYPQRADRYEEMLISAEYDDMTLLGQHRLFRRAQQLGTRRVDFLVQEIITTSPINSSQSEQQKANSKETHLGKLFRRSY